jgi:hypothetical protein
MPMRMKTKTTLGTMNGWAEEELGGAEDDLRDHRQHLVWRTFP